LEINDPLKFEGVLAML